MSGLLRQQILAMRASAQAVVGTADAILAALEAPAEGPCAHPPAARRPAPRMGTPDAWVCACGTTGEA